MRQPTANRILDCVDGIMDCIPEPPATICENDVASIIEECNAITSMIIADAQYEPVIRITQEEVALQCGVFPGRDDLEKIASRVSSTLMELGYWDTVKQITTEYYEDLANF